MRNTDLPSIDLDLLVAVTGGCKKKAPPPQAPPPQQQQAPQSYGPSVDVTVATGAQAAQLIQGARQ